MKKYFLFNTITSLGLLIIFLFIWKYQDKKPVVDLPEEYMGISKDSLHPDTMLSYYSGDTVYLYFKH